MNLELRQRPLAPLITVTAAVIAGSVAIWWWRKA
jgi:hypothetical protein